MNDYTLSFYHNVSLSQRTEQYVGVGACCITVVTVMYRDVFAF